MPQEQVSHCTMKRFTVFRVTTFESADCWVWQSIVTHVLGELQQDGVSTMDDNTKAMLSMAPNPINL